MESESLILMATYNGGKYIAEQIESIKNQTYKAWTLLIRDDGSSDNTISIIKEFTMQDKRIKLIENTSAQHGAYINFWTLIHEAKDMEEYDYYFFCDQDDIWPSERMQWMINEAEHIGAEVPLLVYGDMQVIDGDGKLLIESLNDTMGIGEMSGYSEYYSSGFVWGCNAMINKALFQSTPVLNLNNPHINIMSHDNYYSKFAFAIGRINFIPKKCIKHRRYGSNTTGNYYLKLSPFTVMQKATNGYANTARTHALGYVQTLETINMIKKINLDTQQGIADVEKAITNGGITGVFIMAKQKVKRKQLSRTLGIYLIMLLGSYKKYMNDF